jgi:hypothetical protein
MAKKKAANLPSKLTDAEQDLLSGRVAFGIPGSSDGVEGETNA